MKLLKRQRNADNMDAGQDSFLDIVSNIVGILIILVIVAGLRVKHAPSDEVLKIETSPQIREKHEQVLGRFQSVHLDCLELSDQLGLMQQQTALRQAEHMNLIQHAGTLQGQIALFQETLDMPDQELFVVQRGLSETDAKIEQLSQGIDWFKKNRPQAITLENLPTAKTKLVAEKEKEIHFRLLGGRIAHVPFSRLFEKMKLESLKRQNELLHTQSRIVGEVGPIEGFRLKFSIVRHDLPMHIASATGQRAIIELERGEFLPENDALGETISQALQPHSAFMQKILMTNQSESTITIWVYPDSFAPYQQVKELLFQRGYLAAARPLTSGTPIAASPDGSRTSRQ